MYYTDDSGNYIDFGTTPTPANYVDSQTGDGGLKTAISIQPPNYVDTAPGAPLYISQPTDATPAPAPAPLIDTLIATGPPGPDMQTDASAPAPSVADQLASAYNSGDTSAVNDILASNQLTSTDISNMFPGFDTSSVSPDISYYTPPDNASFGYDTAKAGGLNYVATLRNWNRLQHFLPMKEQANKWFNAVGGKAIDRSGLQVEENLQRYRHYQKGILVRIDSGTTKDELDFLHWIKKDLGVNLRLSAETLIPGPSNLVVEKWEEFVRHATEFDRVRWLSAELAPTNALMEVGIGCDRRSITQRGDIELTRWLLEQSVSITQHRYGNTNAGPKPKCAGLLN
jgi:hypothetical protein